MLKCRNVLLAVAAASILAPLSAHAQTYPSKPITIVVPAAPGGVTDVLGRTLAKHFTQDWGATLVVENRPGANNQVAAEYVLHQPADGYTLFIGPEVTFTANPSLYPDLRYSLKDFTPISGLATIYHGLILNPSVPVNSVKELIDLGKQKPGALNYGTYGVGSTGHLNMELFEAMAGVKFVPVHYKGAQPAMLDVIAGNIQMMLISVGNAVEQAKAGRVKFIADGAPQRMKLLPDIPAIAETVPGYAASSWFGLYGPAGITAGVVAKINAEVRKTFDDPDVVKNVLDPQYFESIAGTPEELTAKINAEEPRFRKVIETAHIKVE
jgi:tripartite-type tricarboxylate transporter receptor subunit TctC